MKLLFDFDGVLTLPHREAARYLELFQYELGSEQARLDSAQALLKSHPERHGWRSGRELSAFSDEDPFIKVQALADILDSGAEGAANAAADRAWKKMTAEALHSPIEREAIQALAECLRLEHEVVIVSNSSTDRISALLQGAGFSGQLRIRGGARKFELGSQGRRLDGETERPVSVDRPGYERILREERPDRVVGDVFSLDLALPLQLKRESPEHFGDLKAFLRCRDYTPSWSKRACTRQLGGEVLTGGLTEILG